MVSADETLVLNVATARSSTVARSEDRCMLLVATVYGTIGPGTENSVATEADWQHVVKRVLKGELAKKGVTHRELAERLKAMGVQDITEANLKNKISRGTFSAVFLFQCLAAIKTEMVFLNMVEMGLVNHAAYEHLKDIEFSKPVALGIRKLSEEN